MAAVEAPRVVKTRVSWIEQRTQLNLTIGKTIIFKSLKDVEDNDSLIQTL